MYNSLDMLLLLLFSWEIPRTEMVRAKIGTYLNMAELLSKEFFHFNNPTNSVYEFQLHTFLQIVGEDIFLKMLGILFGV